MTARKKAPAAQKPAGELDIIRSLAGILNDTGLTEIEFEQKGTRVRVSRGHAVAAPAAHVPVVHAQAAAPSSPLAVQPAAPGSAPAKSTELDHPGTVRSPMVGTAYRSPSPGTAAFVEIGSTVTEGQTVVIIEAMKTMNQIPAPRSGKITRIFVENGQPVEFGEPLLVIE